MTKEELIAFEEDIANCFNNKQIRAPIHLQSDCFKQLIDIFKYIDANDWILGSWRFHSEALLKGVPNEVLKKEVLKGKSISLCFPDFKVFCSAIVGGILPIGVGIALGLKQQNKREKVWIFCGEMTATTGIFYESLNYSVFHNLPITFVVADNEKSVCTNTRNVWNVLKLPYEPNDIKDGLVHKTKHLWYYKYTLSWPHAGSGSRIQF